MFRLLALACLTLSVALAHAEEPIFAQVNAIDSGRTSDASWGQSSCCVSNQFLAARGGTVERVIWRGYYFSFDDTPEDDFITITLGLRSGGDVPLTQADLAGIERKRIGKFAGVQNTRPEIFEYTATFTRDYAIEEGGDYLLTIVNDTKQSGPVPGTSAWKWANCSKCYSGENSYYAILGEGGMIGEPPESMVFGLGDIDRNGTLDIAKVDPDGSVRVEDTNGQLVSSPSFSTIDAIADVELIADINGNGAPELAAIGFGSAPSEVRDSLSGEQLNVDNPRVEPLVGPADLALVGDYTGNGVPELAILSTEQSVVRIHDAAKQMRLGSVFSPGQKQLVAVRALPDFNGDGVAELGLLGESKRPNFPLADLLEVHDPVTRQLLTQKWFSKDWHVLQFELIRDISGDGRRDIAVLRTSNGNSRPQIVLVATNTAMDLLGLIRLDSAHVPQQLLVIPDINGNMMDEIVVFGPHQDGRHQRAQIRDSLTGERLDSVYFDRAYPSVDVHAMADINFNRSAELVMLGKNSAGEYKVFVKDSKTRQLLGRINFSSDSMR